MQPGSNDPLQIREVKPLLSRSCPPLLWISVRVAIISRGEQASWMSRRLREFFPGRGGNFPSPRAADCTWRLAPWLSARKLSASVGRPLLESAAVGL